MSLRRLAATLLVAGAAVLGTALPAYAHSELKSSTPAEGATLAELPKVITLTFSEDVTTKPEDFAVTGAGGERWQLGAPKVEGAVVTIPVQPVGPAGPYHLEYRVVAGDGDITGGVVNFTMSVAGAAAPTTTTEAPAPTSQATQGDNAPAQQPTADAQQSKGVPSWVWIVGILVVVVIVVVLVLMRGRRSGRKS
ncbi:copper resistance CopC family protein [Actinokineospora enzanensis]|uniref:copper resistance CopC family protein n=1 Tax=Actinokineospora enzanensis TaxID=155975 RepID=UPI00037A87DF|nr:copper resistance CopC family protein [Actinokineospora enzanensis]